MNIIHKKYAGKIVHILIRRIMHSPFWVLLACRPTFGEVARN